ncbi:hypothetical protein MBGDN05_00822 [Thermoplasmatales archaeon SCGC AB-539-N05]|nr:hypothetical protein MBGDN05_00822 [Thermoplasmatales archaeon SCGC AB-539-N05]
MNQQQKKSKAVNINTAEATENPLLDEPLTFGLILRGLPQEIQELKDFLGQSPLSIIYKQVSYGKLFITTREDLNDKK